MSDMTIPSTGGGPTPPLLFHQLLELEHRLMHPPKRCIQWATELIGNLHELQIAVISQQQYLSLGLGQLIDRPAELFLLLGCLEPRARLRCFFLGDQLHPFLGRPLTSRRAPMI